MDHIEEGPQCENYVKEGPQNSFHVQDPPQHGQRVEEESSGAAEKTDNGFGPGRASPVRAHSRASFGRFIGTGTVSSFGGDSGAAKI